MYYDNVQMFKRNKTIYPKASQLKERSRVPAILSGESSASI